MKISFYTRGNLVQARINDGLGQCVRLSTKMKVPYHLSFKGGKFVGSTPDVKSLNKDLEIHRVQLVELYQEHTSLNKVKNLFKPVKLVEQTDNYNLVPLCKEYLIKAQNGLIKTRNGMKFAVNTLKCYTNAVSHFVEFSGCVGDINLQDMAIESGYDIQKKRRLTEKWHRHFKAFDDYMISKKLSLSTRSNITNYISIIVHYYQKDLYLMLPPITYATPEPNPIIVLEPEFVQRFLTDEELYKSLEGPMKYTWEICATILITTMRLDDAVSMSAKDLHITSKEVFLSKPNGKTRAVTDMPLPEFLGAIYKANIADHGTIFCMEGEKADVYNNIGELFAKYEEMHNPVTVRRIGVNGEDTTEVIPMHEYVHPHMLRKTAITTMIYYQMSERHIKFCSGHTINSAAFERYVAFVERHFKSEVSGFYEKLLAVI